MHGSLNVKFEEQEFTFNQKSRFFFSVRVQSDFVAEIFLSIWNPKTVSSDVRERGVKLSTCIHILQSYKTQGTSPPLSVLPSGLMIN